jgi:hypothetical protein
VPERPVRPRPAPWSAPYRLRRDEGLAMTGAEDVKVEPGQAVQGRDGLVHVLGEGPGGWPQPVPARVDDVAAGQQPL